MARTSALMHEYEEKNEFEKHRLRWTTTARCAHSCKYKLRLGEKKLAPIRTLRSWVFRFETPAIISIALRLLKKCSKNVLGAASEATRFPILLVVGSTRTSRRGLLLRASFLGVAGFRPRFWWVTSLHPMRGFFRPPIGPLGRSRDRRFVYRARTDRSRLTDSLFSRVTYLRRTQPTFCPGSIVL